MTQLSKSLYIFISTLAFSSNTLANQNNFYVSADVGIFQADFNQTYLDRTDNIAQNISQLAIQHGYTGGIAFGYRSLYCEPYFWGAELAANGEGHNATFQSGASTNAFSDKSQIQYHIDLTFTPGIMLTETIASYLKLGLSFASIQDNLTSPSGFTPVMMSYHSHENVFGFAAGLGISKSLTNHVSVFTEANYHDYGTADFKNFQNFSANYTHSAHVYSCDVLLGATYQF